MLKQAVGQEDNLLYNHIYTEDEAAQQKNVATNISKGVFLLRRRYARGFDLKFAQDAIVVVLALENDVRASEIEQMIGRASRSNGVQQGYVHVVSTLNVPCNKTTIDWIRANDRKNDTD